MQFQSRIMLEKLDILQPRVSMLEGDIEDEAAAEAEDTGHDLPPSPRRIAASPESSPESASGLSLLILLDCI